MPIAVAEAVDMLIRTVNPDVHASFKRNAGARGYRMADYLQRLVDLHEQVKSSAVAGDPAAQDLLRGLGLEPISV